MDPAVIGAIFTGLVGLITAVGGFWLKRTEFVADHTTDLRARLNAALAHIYDLRARLGAAQLPVPDMPDELGLRQSGRHRYRDERGVM